MNPDKVFRKILSLNDTGETGSHMAGILIPKSDLEFFPALETETENPRTVLSMTDRHGRTWKLNYIYYNSGLFDGTRNEYRLTGLTEFIGTNGLVGGDVLTISPRTDGGYRLDFEKKADTERLIAAKQTGFTKDENENTAKTSHDHAMRPAARIIHTIGENLIKDAEAAVIELVKNAYDADARNVYVHFRHSTRKTERRELRVTIEDDGHGMTYEQVVGSWLVPATSDKVSRRTSPSGRNLQGNKGIGRFAAFMLGSEIFLKTVARSSPVETSLLLQASDFKSVEFLDQVRIIVDTRAAPHEGTVGALFEMTSYDGDECFRDWTKDDFGKLRADLRRMLFPFRSRDDQFQVWVDYDGFTDYGQPDGTEEIEPLPVFDFFDYRIKVQISDSGQVSGVFSSPLLPGKPEEKISLTLADLKGAPCGAISVDLRVVDREPAAIQSILDRSRAAEDSLYTVGRAQLKRLLNEACGVSVYRGDFRIRPYGDNGNDWLELDRQRVNNPSFCIGNNQTFGTIAIEAEASSHLQEKSARDGLREDEHYQRLRDSVSRIIQELQRRRYEIRRAVGRIEKSTPVATLLTNLTNFEEPFNRISSLLRTEGITLEKIGRIRDILKQDSEERQEAVAKLEQAIAIYQGQATLGKMVGVLLHEGNRALGILRNQGGRIPVWLQRLLANPSAQVVTEVTDGLNGITVAAESLTGLFDSIQPLGVRTRGAARKIPLARPIRTVLHALDSKLSPLGIVVHVDVPEDFKILAWEQDINSILLNLVENSVHWLAQISTRIRQIHFRLENSEDGSLLDITDNGPGIPREHILSEAIFEPTFSLKGGWGLGLPIAGECAIRNRFELRAVHSDVGAHFVLDFNPLQFKQ
jgi:hypothetical protein